MPQESGRPSWLVIPEKGLYNEKTGYERRTAITVEGLTVLQDARMRNPNAGNYPVLPAPKDPSRYLDRSLVRVWWHRAEALAGLEPKLGWGWHSLRRNFASDLMDQPLKMLCVLGGWNTTHTILQCYQHTDVDRPREALEDRRRASSVLEQRERTAGIASRESRKSKRGG